MLVLLLMNKQDLNRQERECNQIKMVKIWTREEWANRPIELIWKEGCLFCDVEMQKKYIVWSWKYWELKLNKYPYTCDKYHLLAIPRKHYELSTDVPKHEWEEMTKIHVFAKEYFGELEYFSLTRESFGWRSLKHLHIHFIRWKISAWDIVKSINSFEK